MWREGGIRTLISDELAELIVFCAENFQKFEIKIVDTL